MYVHASQPVDVAFRAAGCFIFAGGRLLMVERAANKPQPLHWGVPTGKIEPGETARMGVVRELAEEVGLAVPPDTPIEVARAVVGEAEKGTAFEYISFCLDLPEAPPLRLRAEELRAAAWLAPHAIPGRPVVPYFYNTLRDVLAFRETGRLIPRLTPEAEDDGGFLAQPDGSVRR